MEGDLSPVWGLLNVGGIIVAIISLVALALQKWLPQKGTVEHQRIDQLQEDLKAERQHRIELSAKLDRLNERMDSEAKVNRRFRVREIAWRRWHSMNEIGILNGTVPPLLELPPELLEDIDG